MTFTKKCSIIVLQTAKGGVNPLGMSEKIKILLVKEKKTLKELAEAISKQTGKTCSSANLSNKLKRDNFSEKELKEVAEALGYDFEGVFTSRSTGEKI